jgi:hypothetical protein
MIENECRKKNSNPSSWSSKVKCVTELVLQRFDWSSNLLLLYIATLVLHKDEYGDILDLWGTKLVTKVFGWLMYWRLKLWTLKLRVYSKRKSANLPAVTWGYAPGHKWFLPILVITRDFQPRERARWKHISKWYNREPLKRSYFLFQQLNWTALKRQCIMKWL